MKNLITEEHKNKLKVIFNRSINIVIVVATLTAGFGLGYYAEQLKAKAGQVDEVIIDKEVRIAIDSENKLIIMDRLTGRYTIYSDSIGKSIFYMYAKKIAQ